MYEICKESINKNYAGQNAGIHLHTPVQPGGVFFFNGPFSRVLHILDHRQPET